MKAVSRSSSTTRSRRGRGPAEVERAVVVELPGAATPRLVVVADTHSQPHPRAAERIAAIEPHAILHAGDIGDLAVLTALGRIAPVYAVRGNIDARIELPDRLVLDLRWGERATRIFMTHIAVAGPVLRADVARRARAAGAPLVVCGHSHVPFIGGDRSIAVFNPGSIGPRRFHLPIVFGRIDFGDRLRLTHIDVETGAVWLPP